MKKRGPRQSAFMTSAMLVDHLHGRYPAKEYAFFTQAASNTGGPADRTADALALALWPSRGLTLTGFEIKISRGDWIRELRNPEKAERIAAYCDFWYVVANAGNVGEQELPPNWGLMMPNEDGTALMTVKPAAKLEPKVLDRSFVAALMRNIGDTMVPRESVEIKLEEARRAGITEGERRVADVSELQRLRELEARVEEFENLSGLSLRYLREYTGESVKAIGAAVRALCGGAKEFEWKLRAIDRAADAAKELHLELRKQAQAIKSVVEKIATGTEAGQ